MNLTYAHWFTHRWFSIDKTYGNIYTKKRLDREERDRYSLQIKTTNDPDIVCEGKTCDITPSDDPDNDSSVVVVQIFVEDKNDNLPVFEQREYFVGIPFDAKVGDLILDAQVTMSPINITPIYRDRVMVNIYF